MDDDCLTELRIIKVSKETYAELSALAGEIQARLKRSVSMGEAIELLLRHNKKGRKITDLAGLWKNIDDKEAERIESSIEEVWKKWKA